MSTCLLFLLLIKLESLYDGNTNSCNFRKIRKNVEDRAPEGEQRCSLLKEEDVELESQRVEQVDAQFGISSNQV